MGGFLIGRFGIPGVSSGEKVTSDAVAIKIEKCADLVSAKAYCAGLYEYDNKGQIPYITKTTLTVYYVATVYASVDLTDVVPVVDDEALTITVTIPEAQIMDVSTDEDEFRAFNKKSSLTDPIDFDVNSEVRSEAKQDAKKKAKELGLLDDAEDNAKEIIEGFLSPFTEEEYADKDGNCYEVIVEVEGEDADEAEEADEEE